MIFLENSKKALQGFRNKDAFWRHSVSYLAAEYIGKSINLLALPIYSLIMPISDYGVMALFITAISIAEILIGLNVRTALLRYYQEFDHNTRPQAIGAALILITGSALVILLLYGSFSREISNFLCVPKQALPVIICASTLIGIYHIYTSILRSTLTSRQFALLEISRNILMITATLITIPLFDTNKYWARIWVQLGVSAIFCLIAFLRILTKTRISFPSPATTKRLLAFSAPLIPHQLSGVIMSQFGLVSLSQKLGTATSGMYNMSTQISMIMLSTVAGSNNAWVPSFTSMMNAGEHEKISQLARKSIFGQSIFASLLILFSREIAIPLGWQYNEQFYLSTAIATLSYFIMSYYFLFSTYSFYYARPSLIVIGTILSCCVNIAGNYMITPHIGLFAAPISLLLGNISMTLFHLIAINTVLPKQGVVKIARLAPPLVFPITAVLVVKLLSNSSLIFDILTKILLLIIGALMWRQWKQRASQC